MALHGTGQACRHLQSWFHKATGSHHILRASAVLGHIKLIVHYVLLIHCQLKVQRLTLLDKGRVVTHAAKATSTRIRIESA